MFDHVVPIPTDKRMIDVRAWLIEFIGQSDDAWTITVDMEVVNYFRRNGLESELLATDEDLPLNDKFFVISFKNEEDKVKFILSFL